jgi:VWFA-related protein
MRLTGSLALIALTLASIAAVAARQAPQRNTPPPAPGQLQSSESGYVLKVKTRLVTVDVVATDSHGNVVRDLKPEEVQLFAERNAPQKIAHFEFVNSAPAVAPAPLGQPSPASPVPPPKVYSNQVAFEGLKISPTVLLLDALNTTLVNQIEARKHMVTLLKTLPPDTPVAVFLLSNRLRLVQSFTSDPAVLRAVIDKLGQANQVEQDPRDDADSTLNAVEGASADTGGDLGAQAALADFEDFEKEEYAHTIDLRVQVTLDALTSIARSVNGVPGRKNLVWMSESFPMSIDPDSDSGSDVFAGTRSYSDKVEVASNALTDAQVAVYPVDVRGLEVSQAFSASQGPIPNRNNGRALSAQITREQNARFQTQATMRQLAENTGGRPCVNTNALSACVGAALKDSSSYYELAFYPENIKWDGGFHKIVVKTTRRDVSLSYRRGYFALDGEELAKEQKPDDRLRQACSDFLPSSAIHLVARPVPPASVAQEKQLRYLITIAPDALTLVQNGAARAVNVEAAICQFGVKDNSFRISKQDLSGNVPDDALEKWQEQGLPDSIVIDPDDSSRRVRFAVLDVPTGLTGAVDVPARLADLQTFVAAPVPAVATVAPPALIIPDRGTQSSQPMGTMIFHGPSGQSGTLDWNGDTLAYRGELAIDQSAPAFFGYAFGARFRCQAGNLVSSDPAGGEPKLQVTVRNYNGRFATIDLKGGEPQYSGTLVVDSTARAFFQKVWQLSRCGGN